MSNVTPRYLGCEQKGRMSLLGLIFNSRSASFLLRRKIINTVFVVLMFSFQVWRDSPTVAMSWLAPLPLPAGLHQHAWLLDRQNMHTFWRRLLAGQRCRCWRCWKEGAPRQISVVTGSWGVVTCSFIVSGDDGEAAIANHLHDYVDHVCIRQQLQQLAGEAAVLYSVEGCCEFDSHSFDIRSYRKAIIHVLCQQGDLVYGRPPVSKACLLLWEQLVDNRFDMSVGWVSRRL